MQIEIRNGETHDAILLSGGVVHGVRIGIVPVAAPAAVVEVVAASAAEVRFWLFDVSRYLHAPLLVSWLLYTFLLLTSSISCPAAACSLRRLHQVVGSPAVAVQAVVASEAVLEEVEEEEEEEEVLE